LVARDTIVRRNAAARADANQARGTLKDHLFRDRFVDLVAVGSRTIAILERV